MLIQDSTTIPETTPSFQDDHFRLHHHLQSHLGVCRQDLDQHLRDSQQELRQLGEREFNWDDPEAFYSSSVQRHHLYELSAWHVDSSDYIGQTLDLVSDRASGAVLDFGGGIGTHSIGAALVPGVSRVDYVDLNPVNRAFVAHRVEDLQLSQVNVLSEPALDRYDTILCFDVLEHLADPVAQLRRFFSLLQANGSLVCNWYFSRGSRGEYPFHLDDPAIIRSFLLHLQLNFLEEFHPHLITARSYRLHPDAAHDGLPRWRDACSA